MPLIASMDGATRRIFLDPSVIDSSWAPLDVFKEYLTFRRDNEQFRGWYPLIKMVGGEPKDATRNQPRLLQMLTDDRGITTKLVLPVNAGAFYRTKVSGEISTDVTETDAEPFDTSNLTGPVVVDYKPAEAEVIQVNSAQIAFASFNGGITVDLANLTGNATNSGAISNQDADILGALQHPCDNLPDTALRLNDVGLGQVYVVGDLPLNDNTDWIRVAFIGESPNKTLMTIDPAAQVLNCEFYDATVQGTLDGNSFVQNCVIQNLDFVDGQIVESSIGPGVIQLGISTVANFIRCNSNLPGPSQQAIIDMNASGILVMRDYTGGARARNYSGADEHSIDLARGQFILENTITSGVWVFRGIGKLLDQNGNSILSDIDSSGRPQPTVWNGATILNELLNQENISRGLAFSNYPMT